MILLTLLSLAGSMNFDPSPTGKKILQSLDLTKKDLLSTAKKAVEKFDGDHWREGVRFTKNKVLVQHNLSPASESGPLETGVWKTATGYRGTYFEDGRYQFIDYTWDEGWVPTKAKDATVGSLRELYEGSPQGLFIANAMEQNVRLCKEFCRDDLDCKRALLYLGTLTKGIIGQFHKEAHPEAVKVISKLFADKWEQDPWLKGFNIQDALTLENAYDPKTEVYRDPIYKTLGRACFGLRNSDKKLGVLGSASSLSLWDAVHTPEVTRVLQDSWPPTRMEVLQSMGTALMSLYEHDLELVSCHTPEAITVNPEAQILGVTDLKKALTHSCKECHQGGDLPLPLHNPHELTLYDGGAAIDLLYREDMPPLWAEVELTQAERDSLVASLDALLRQTKK